MLSIGKEVAAMARMTVKELRAKYLGAFGEETGSGNRQWLVKRIAWRLQMLAEGDLSERARQRAAELARDADLRLSPPKFQAASSAPERTKTLAIAVSTTNRVPIPGTVITRVYKGRTLQVKVLASGFEFEGEVFKSLSALAKTITGQHCNGYFFFRLGKEATR